MTLTETKTQRSIFFRSKFAPLITLFFLFFNQVLPVYADVPVLAPYEDTQNRHTPTESVEDPPQESPGVSSENIEDEDSSQSFLSQQVVLEPVDAPPNQSEENESQNYVTEIYDTPARGIHEVQPGTPVAYLAHHLTREDLRVLREQNEELGLLIAGDLVVIYSTGDEEFIRELLPIHDLTESSLVRLSAHFHKEGPPSEVDLHEEAGIQYVITTTSRGEEVVWVHDGARITGSMTYDEFVRYAEDLRIRSDVDPVEVRRLLNQYIAAIDQYRETGSDLPLIRPMLFAHEGTDTVLPGKPFLGIFETNPATQDNDFVQSSSSKVRFNYDVRPAGSFAALSVQFDNLGTTPIETQDLSGFSEIKFGIASNNTCISGLQPCLRIEFEDRFGTKASFGLLAISTTHRHYTILKSQFSPTFRLDQVRFVNFVYDQNLTKPETRTGFLELTTGGLFFIPKISPDPTNPAITKLPRNSLDARPVLTAFASQDGSTADATVFSSTFARLNYTGAGTDSFGGVFVHYDDPNTTPKEFINLNTAFPTGIVLSLDNNGTSLSEVSFEVKDANGKTDTVTLINITSTGQRWKILTSLFDDVDVTKIVTLVLVVKGPGTRRLSVDWGDFYFVPSIPPDPSLDPDDITRLPRNSQDQRPEIIGFAKQDGSTSDVTVFSPTFARVRYNGSGAESFGGAFINYDDFNTTPKEFINFQTLFPTGFVIGLDNNSSGAGEVVFEVTDVNGKKDTVKLISLQGFGQRWKILASAFDEVDTTRITTLTFVFTGQGVKEISIDGGEFYFVPSIPPDPTLDPDDITKLPRNSLGQRPELIGFAKLDGSTSEVTVFSPTFARLRYTGTAADSFGGAFVNYDDLNTTPKESINLNTLYPNGLVIGLDHNNSGVTEVVLEVSDANGKKDTVKLVSLAGFGQRWKVLPSQFDEVDITKIVTLVFVFTGQGTKEISVDWGEFFFIPSMEPDPSLDADDVTLFSDIKHLVKFESDPPNADGTVNINILSKTRFNLTYDLTNEDSFGGSITSFDDFGTPGKEFKDLRGQTLVFGLKDAGSPRVILQLEDADGKKDKVLLNSVSGTEKFWAINTVLFDEIDLSRITGLVFLLEEDRLTDTTSTLEVRLGNHPFIPSLPPDPTLDADDITLFNDIRHLVKFESDPPNPDGSVTLNQLSKTRFNLTYDLTNEDSFGGSITSFDDFGTVPKETKDLRNQTIIFGLRDPGSPGVLIQLEDDQGRKDQVLLTGVNGTEKFWAVNTALFDDIDLSKVTVIVFLLEEDRLTDTTSTLEVRLGNHPFTPVLDGSTFDQNALTTLNNEPELSAFGGNTVAGQPDGKIELIQLSSIEFEYEYDLTPSPTSFVFTNITRGSAVLDLPENLILAVRGREGGQAKVEITDTNGLKMVFILNLRPIYQNYTLVLSPDNVPTGFNRHSVQTITFVEDQALAGAVSNDLVKVKTKGLKFTAPILPDDFIQVREALIRDGLTYFHSGVGVDPATGFPRDHVNGTLTAGFTQPTLIGFLLQIRGDQVNGKTDREGQTVLQLLSQIDTVMTNLLDVQADFGWNGLLPFLNLDPLEPMTTRIGLGDNANLAQSLAVLIGSLESATLTPAEEAAVDLIIEKIEEFLDNQAAGYAAFVDPTFGIFRASYDTATGEFDNYIDRLANEFRGGIAFLKVRYPSLPDTVWANLVPIFRNYTDRNGNTVKNLAPFDGGAFQMFWSILKNGERDFIGFRNALFNHLATQTDFSSQFLIPGFLSASQRPTDTTEGSYYGRIGILDIAEANVSHLKEFLLDVGSTYALASAMPVDIVLVLGWLNAIEDQLTALDDGAHGFYDAARSNTELARIFLGIDIGSTVLGLVNAGAEAFEAYLRNRDLELTYNLLYDSASRLLNIPKAVSTIAGPPSFADDSLAVFTRFTSEGVVNNFPAHPTTFTGVDFNYGALQGGFGGQFWNIPVHEVRANRFVLMYSITDSPGEIKVEFKDVNDIPLFQMVVDLVDTPGFHTLVIDLPNLEALEAVAKVFVIIDQNATGDTSGDFFIHVMDFQHPPGRHHTHDAIEGTEDLTVFIPDDRHVDLLEDYSVLERLLLKGSFRILRRRHSEVVEQFQTTPLFWSTADLVKRISKGRASDWALDPFLRYSQNERFKGGRYYKSKKKAKKLSRKRSLLQTDRPWWKPSSIEEKLLNESKIAGDTPPDLSVRQVSAHGVQAAPQKTPPPPQ